MFSMMLVELAVTTTNRLHSSSAADAGVHTLVVKEELMARPTGTYVVGTQVPLSNEGQKRLQSIVDRSMGLPPVVVMDLILGSVTQEDVYTQLEARVTRERAAGAEEPQSA